MTDFTHKGYLGFLKLIRDLDRRIVSFRDIPTESDYVILRHDIDFSLRYAVEMAHLDRNAGATSTFFILLTAPYYNPLSEDGVRAIREIAELGHECGLHYDCTGFELLSPDQRVSRIKVMASTLEDVIGAPIRAIAQHKPSRSPIRQGFSSYVDAYATPYFSDIAYLSDSRMMFRVPDVAEFMRQSPKSQVLIHPIWWRPERMTRTAIFETLRMEMSETTEKMLRSEDEAIARALSDSKAF